MLNKNHFGLAFDLGDRSAPAHRARPPTLEAHTPKLRFTKGIHQSATRAQSLSPDEKQAAGETFAWGRDIISP
jgi:hypothetical protein